MKTTRCGQRHAAHRPFRGHQRFLAHAVAEIFLIFGLAEIEKWQHRDTFWSLSGNISASSPRYHQIVAAPRRRQAAPVATNVGLRRDQRQIRGELRPGGRRSVVPRASARDQRQDHRRIGSALSDHARDSVHKWFPNRGRASGTSERSFGAGFSAACRMMESACVPRNGARPVSRSKRSAPRL